MRSGLWHVVSCRTRIFDFDGVVDIAKGDMGGTDDKGADQERIEG